MKRARRILQTVSLNIGVAVAGFVFGVVALYLFISLRGPELDVWHTEKLASEFKARDVKNEIQTLPDYLQLEAELFRELDEEIYQVTKTGPDFALVRFSKGSRSDPGKWPANWNRTFELRASEPKGGVLLLHGMSDSPYSLRALGEGFHREGHHVLGLRLPGHGTIPSGLLKTKWEDMAAAVTLGMQHLEAETGGAPLIIVGYSTGAGLALNHVLDAMEEEAGVPMPERLILISPSIGITRAAMLAKWKRRVSVLPGMKKLAWTDVMPRVRSVQVQLVHGECRRPGASTHPVGGLAH